MLSWEVYLLSQTISKQRTKGQCDNNSVHQCKRPSMHQSVTTCATTDQHSCSSAANHRPPFICLSLVVRTGCVALSPSHSCTQSISFGERRPLDHSTWIVRRLLSRRRNAFRTQHVLCLVRFHYITGSSSCQSFLNPFGSHQSILIDVSRTFPLVPKYSFCLLFTCIHSHTTPLPLCYNKIECPELLRQTIIDGQIGTFSNRAPIN